MRYFPALAVALGFACLSTSAVAVTYTIYQGRSNHVIATCDSAGCWKDFRRGHRGESVVATYKNGTTREIRGPGRYTGQRHGGRGGKGHK
jgi:hypothetical protein